MKYVNQVTGFEIELVGLTEKKEKFYQQAVGKFRKNTDWFAFEEFGFGLMSPLYVGRKSHLEVMGDPLYLALEDMWLQLGVQQGMVKTEAGQKGKAIVKRRQESGGRQTSDKSHGPKARHMATAR